MGRHDERAGTTLLSLLPAALVGAAFLLIAFRPTRYLILWALEEDRPVESLTVLFFLAASITAFQVVRSLRQPLGQRWVRWFYAAFAVLLLLVAMEEISWGQRILGFETPAGLRDINGQGETTLHNIGVFQGRSEWVRFGFGLAGLIAIRLRDRPGLSAVAVAPRLWPWFLVIAIHAAVDATNDIVTIEPRFDYAVDRTSELIELLMSVTTLLYMRDSLRRFRSAAAV
jgi:hypothetical protein